MSTKEQTQTFKDSITTALLNANLNVSKVSFVRRPARSNSPHFIQLADGTKEVVINLANNNLDVDAEIKFLVFLKQFEDKLEARMAARRSKTQ